jgi:hypothetical protein
MLFNTVLRLVGIFVLVHTQTRSRGPNIPTFSGWDPTTNHDRETHTGLSSLWNVIKIPRIWMDPRDLEGGTESSRKGTGNFD